MKKDIIYINDLSVSVKDWNLNLLQLCEEVDIVIPRFCYHDELSVAGNCRMCLIEVMNSPKPIISCGCMLTKEMKVYTNSILVKKAREYVMEFLLINHPLDCPICDQGGECDLQDQSFVYGSDRGRFKEIKRAVEDIDLGPFIKTIMNRCIHCTRCVRFSQEILNINSLSMLGRGRESEIGTYCDQEYLHELSGNVIDLCPVGALTSKPYTFSARPWELFSMESIDILNSFCSDIKVDIKGNEIMRILPVTDKFFETEWITDSIRFCFDGIKKDRLVNPIIYDYKDNYFFSCSWEFSYYVINFFCKQSQFIIYKGDNLDFGSLYLIEHFIINNPKMINKYDSNYLLDNISEKLIHPKQLLNLENDIVFFFNLNLKQSNPVLDSLFKKKHVNVNFFYVGSRVDMNYNINHVGLNKKSMFFIFKGKHFVCNKLFNKNNIYFFSNNRHINNFFFYFNTSLYFFNKKFSILENSTTINNSIFLGESNKKKNFFFFYSSYIHKVNLLINYDNNINYNNLFNNYNIFIGHHMINNSVDSNLILPSKIFLEEEISFYNFSGFIKTTSIVLDYLDLSKSLKDIIYLFFSNNNKYFFQKVPFFFEKNNILFFSKKNELFFNSVYFFFNYMYIKKINSYCDNILSKKSVSLLKAEYEKKKRRFKNYNF
jgi:NADH dehydrogenase (ubiquinone) Fe-S protein 1